VTIVLAFCGLQQIHADASVAPAASRCFTEYGFHGEAVFLNITPVNASAPGYGFVTFRGFGSPVSSPSSNVNFAPGTIDPNFAAVPLLESEQFYRLQGELCFVNSNHGHVDVVVDDMGHVVADAFVSTDSGAPSRVLDTRIGLGGPRVPRGGRVCFRVAGEPGDVALVNLTPVLAADAGYGLMVSSDVGAVPLASNVNFARGTIDPNVGLASIGADGRVCFINSRHASVDIVADHMGSIKRGSFVLPSSSGAPTRVLDTRLRGRPVSPGERVCFDVGGSRGDAALINLTPVHAQGSGYGVLVSSDVATPPVASNVNFASGTIDPNVAIAPTGADGRVCYVNSIHTAVDIVADHLGSVKAASFRPTTTTGAPRRVLDTRLVGEVSLTTLATVHALDCSPDGQLCVAAGQSSGGDIIVFRSADTGVTWTTPQSLAADGPVSEIDCPTPRTCLIVGGSASDGIVLRTEDAGLTFSEVSTPIAGQMADVSCTDAEQCIVVGNLDPPSVVRTDDGGDTWTAIASPYDQMFEIDCPQAANCLASAARGGVPTIARSTDGGTTWLDTPQELVGGTFEQFSYLRCFDALRCTAFHRQAFIALGRTFSNRMLVRTSDGGATWSVRGAPVGGWSDCALPTWCVQSLGPSSISSFSTASDQWTDFDVAADAGAVQYWPRPRVSCPINQYCFFIGDTGSGSFVTRMSNPS
jgi:hypothetical protein